MEAALLQIPNDSRLVKLILEGGKGDRSSALYQLAVLLGERGVRPEVAETVLRYSDERWGKFFERSDYEARISDLLEAYKAKAKAPLEEPRWRRLVPLTLAELLDIEVVDDDWLVKDLILRDSYNLVTGPTGVGKTQLLFHMAYHLVSGKQWFEWVVPEKKNVLFVEKEMSQRELVRMVQVMKENLLLEEDSGRLDFLPVGEVVSTLTEHGQDFYEEHAERYDVILIDTLSSATHTNIKDEDGVRTMVDFLLSLAHRGVTIIAAHHDVKSPTSGGAEDVYGNRWIIDKASSILRMSRQARDVDEIQLTTPKVRSASDKTKLSLFRSDSLWFTGQPFEMSPKQKAKAVSSRGVEGSGLF